MRSEPRQRVVADTEERGGMGEWPKLRFSDAVLINPPVHLERGKSYPSCRYGCRACRVPVCLCG